MNSIYEIPVQKIDGTVSDLSSYHGQVLLIVNVASQCGFTPQYHGLQNLYRKYKDQGFAILGFPCNQFGNQEPDSNIEIRKFCELHYHVTFPMFSKINVNGENAHPLFQYLKSRARGVLGSLSVKWNFTKFLVDRSGNVRMRFAPATPPESLEGETEKLLSEAAQQASSVR